MPSQEAAAAIPAAVKPREYLSEVRLRTLEELELYGESAIGQGSLEDEFDEVPRSCYWAGPLGDSKEQEILSRRLQDHQLVVEPIHEQISEGWRYWVYLPPKASRAEAESDLVELQLQGVDSYLILRGQHVYGISLGLFSKEAWANDKVAEIEAKGGQPKIESFEKIREQRWVSVSKAQADALGDGVLARMFENKSHIKIIEKKCDFPVASHAGIH